MVAPGIKMSPFVDARRVGNLGCGGIQNSDPGVQIPTDVYRPGANIVVTWVNTIPHYDDRLTTGIRVALCFSPDDCFECNILTGGVEGDPGFVDLDGDDVFDKAVATGTDGLPANTEVSALLQLPPGKTGNYVTLQLLTAGEKDNGFYLSCADIAITADGLLPDYSVIDRETDAAGTPNAIPQNNLPNAQQECVSTPDGSSGMGAVGGIVVALLMVGGFFFWFFKIRKPSAGGEGGGGGSRQAGARGGGGKAPERATEIQSMLSPKPARAGSARAGSGQAVPAGWHSAVDPTSGQTYYVDAAGASHWELPSTGAGASDDRLPAGWEAVTDPGTGREYYANPETGAVSWEVPQAHI